MKKPFQFMAITGLVMSIAMPAFAQNINAVQARIDRLEREMNTLSRSVFRGDVAPPTMQVTSPSTVNNTAAIEMRLGQLETQLRRLTGMIEENSFRIRQMENKATSSVSAPIQPQQPTSSMDGIQSESLMVDTSPYQLGTITNAPETPARLYDKAFSFLQVNDYASAQATFEDFIDQYPDHSLAPNSKFWIGETHYERQDYASASQAFARAFKDHPDGQKAPDTLLKLAMSLKAQDMSNEACLTLDELAKRFPNAPSSVATRANEERQLYGCDS